MGVNLATFQIVLIVMIIVGVILIVHSAWVLSQLNSTIGDECLCSGVSTSQVNSLYIFSVMVLLVGIAMIIYALVLFMTSGSGEKHSKRRRLDMDSDSKSRKSRIAERVTSEGSEE